MKTMAAGPGQPEPLAASTAQVCEIVWNLQALVMRA